jgi:hypothetical protein
MGGTPPRKRGLSADAVEFELPRPRVAHGTVAAGVRGR